MTTRRPARINWHMTKQMREMYAMLPLLVTNVPRNVAVYAVNQRCGRAYFKKRMITIPFHAINRPKGDGYTLYYLAHELAHIADDDAGTRDRSKPHGPSFMQQLKRLCPPEYWHWELGYKPRNAAAAGIWR